MTNNYTIILTELHYMKWENIINPQKIFKSVQKYNNNIWMKMMNRY